MIKSTCMPQQDGGSLQTHLTQARAKTIASHPVRQKKPGCMQTIERNKISIVFDDLFNKKVRGKNHVINMQDLLLPFSV